MKTFFIDFDGTITKQDTCDYLAKNFCREGWEEINRLWEEKKISTPECARQILSLMDATSDDFTRLIKTVDLDPYFADFVDICQTNNDRIYILSDGYSFNIRCLLEKHGLSHLTFYANNLSFGQEIFSLDFPHFNEQCGKCGTCKKNLIKVLADRDSPKVYIGDGCSDFCASQSTDFVFAKEPLLTFCRENRIPVYPFQDFSDIIKWLAKN